MLRIRACAFLLLGCCALPMAAQQSPSASSNATVPQVVNFSGRLNDVNQPLTGKVGVTFSLYKESQGGTPLWMETQNVQLDKAGHYSVALGSSSSQGLPPDIFASGEARWLSVQAQGQAEQPRVLLMSVPYALKALDAETIGGKPVSAFMLAPATSSEPGNGALPPANITGSGTADFVPLFTGVTTIGNSKIFQATGGNVGINTTTPAAKLDVKGTSDVRDTLTLFPKSTHPTLSVHGTAFSIDQTGAVTFVAGQSFPGAGTVTSVGSGAGLTGGPITGSGTLSVANGGVANSMLQNPSLTVTANAPLNGGGNVALGSSVSLGLAGCASNQILKWNGSAWACSADNNSGGTVTSVSSGGGLTGGPITGSGTLSIANAGVSNAMLQNSSLTVTANSPLTGGGAVSLGGTTSLGLTNSCASGQILKWNGSAWTCSPDNNSGGTVTSVASGFGLTGGPITGSGTLAVDASVVPELAAENSFTNNNQIFIDSGGLDGLDVYNGGYGVGINVLATYGIQATGGSFPISGSGGSFEGVFGESTTDSDFMAGVFGAETGTMHKTVGILGNSPSFTGAGVYGQNGTSISATGSVNGGAGVWGDGGLNNQRVGVLATTDNNAALLAENNTTSYYTFAAINLSTGGYPLTAVNAAGKGCSINPNGDITCTGSKNALVPIDGGQRKVALAAIESPKNWFEDFGSEQLSSGAAVIRLEPEFAQTVNTQVEYHVFLTPRGDCKGLYVSNESASSFEVHELGGGNSGVRFDYRIVALRKDYENIRLADHTNDPDPLKQFKEGPPTQSDISKMIPPKRAPMMRTVTQQTRRTK